jgi:hypothetical protein
MPKAMSMVTVLSGFDSIQTLREELQRVSYGTKVLQYACSLCDVWGGIVSKKMPFSLHVYAWDCQFGLTTFLKSTGPALKAFCM